MKKYIFLLIVVFIINLASASSIIYEISEKSTTTTINLTKGQIVILPKSYINFNSENGYEISENILTANKSIGLSYKTKEYIKDLENNEFMFNVGQQIQESINVTIILSKGFVISNNLVFPNDVEISSNGQNIILTWKNFDRDEIIVFYERIEKSNIGLYFFVTIGIIIFGIIMGWYQNKNYKKRIKKINEEQRKKQKLLQKTKKQLKKQFVTKNLFGDEKIIIEYLLTKKSKECWTKKMQKDLEISKVRLSRKLRSLEEKGIISKISHGNSNLIKLVN
jgi:uncharacterized membrane protein